MLLLAAVWVPLAAFLTLGSASAQTANSQPAFPSSEDGARSVAENAAAGADGGAPVGAMDADSDVLTYTLGGGDAASFHDARVALQAVYGMIVSKTSLRVAEGGSATYTVKLTLVPASNVVISVTKSGSSDVTVSPATLTFTPSNWNTAQTVTVSAAQDSDKVYDNGSISHAVVAASSADAYDGAIIVAVAVVVVDDDIPGLIMSKTSLRVAEGGSATYTVKLAVLPTSNVVITVTSDKANVTLDTDAATSGNQNGLTFTPSNWNTARTVTVAVAQDADARSDAAIITHTVVAAASADEYDYGTSQMLAFIVENETAGVTVSASALTVAEGGSATYTVKLTVPPVSNVVISVNKSGSSDVTVSPATLTFTPSNWNTAQTVTVAAAHDADARHAETASISHFVLSSSSSNEYVVATIDTVAVTVTDDDTYTVTVSPSTLTVAEGGIGSYAVTLGAEPSYAVVIKLTSDNADVTAPSRWYQRGGRISVAPAGRPLTFTPSDWNTAQTVTVAAAQDADALNETATIRHTVVAAESADEFATATIAAVAVTVTDDDGGATVSKSALTVDEGGNRTYTVALNGQPSSNVVISVTKRGSADVTATPATLTFTNSNWSTAQTVTVAAAHDADAASDAASITHAVVASRSANEFDNATIAAVAVTVTDDDTVTPPSGGDSSDGDSSDGDSSGGDSSGGDSPGGEGSPGGGSPGGEGSPRGEGSPGAEGSSDGEGSSGQTPTFASRTVGDQIYTVGEDVGTVSLPSALRGDGGLRYSLSPDLPPGLRFNSNLTITGTPGAALPRTRFTYTATDSDGDRVGLRFFVTVNERPGVTVSATEVAVAEGGANAYTVVLDAEPASDVVISVTSDNADVTVDTDAAASGDQSTLTFTTATWSTAQTVTVAAAHDTDAVGEMASITHMVVAAGSAAEYAGVTVAGVAVTVVDDATERSVAENTGEGEVVGDPVAVMGQDGGALTYTLGGADAALFTIDADTGQIRVRAETALDYEAEKNVYEVTVTATDSSGASATVAVTITVTDVHSGSYDVNNNEVIDRDETIAAVADYSAGRITKDDVLAVIQLYFAG